MQFSKDQVENSFSLFTGFSVVENTGVGSHSLLQGIFLTQGLNPGLLHWQVDSLPYKPPGQPKLRSEWEVKKKKKKKMEAVRTDNSWEKFNSEEGKDKIAERGLEGSRKIVLKMGKA